MPPLTVGALPPVALPLGAAPPAPAAPIELVVVVVEVEDDGAPAALLALALPIIPAAPFTLEPALPRFALVGELGAPATGGGVVALARPAAPAETGNADAVVVGPAPAAEAVGVGDRDGVFCRGGVLASALLQPAPIALAITTIARALTAALLNLIMFLPA